MRAIFHFKDGELAHRRGRPRAECPHPEDSREGAEWLAGWDAEENAVNVYAEHMLRRDQRERLTGEPYAR